MPPTTTVETQVREATRKLLPLVDLETAGAELFTLFCVQSVTASSSSNLLLLLLLWST
jgi:hypothetical protein